MKPVKMSEPTRFILPSNTVTVIDRFGGEFRFLSNFYMRPIMFLGKSWPSTEHAFQACKTQNEFEQEMIRSQPTPGRAKRAGRNVTLRDDWESIKINTMMILVRKKFSQHHDLAERLLATGDAELIEGNHWGDTFWGVCEGRGRNELGKILMEIRNELRRK